MVSETFMVIDEQSRYADGSFQIFKDAPNSNPLFMVTRNGHVAIGTGNINTNYKLAVNGKMRAKEVVVETGWSDFVFEEDYYLPTLGEVEQHIKEKGQLKDIPSAKDVKKMAFLLAQWIVNYCRKLRS